VLFFKHGLAKDAEENEGNSTLKFRQGRTRAGQNLYNPSLTQGTQNDRLHIAKLAL
jgi:hypothetical protein